MKVQSITASRVAEKLVESRLAISQVLHRCLDPTGRPKGKQFKPRSCLPTFLSGLKSKVGPEDSEAQVMPLLSDSQATDWIPGKLEADGIVKVPLRWRSRRVDGVWVEEASAAASSLSLAAAA